MQVRAQVSGQASCSRSTLHAAGPKRSSAAAPKLFLQHPRIQRHSRRVNAQGERGEGRSKSLCSQDDDGMAKQFSHSFIEFYSIPPSNLFHAGPLESVVEKVKDALGIDTDPVDENILEYCSLDQTVSAFRSQSSQPAFHIWTSSPQSLTC